MRRALATAGVTGVLALAPFATAPASAAAPTTATAVHTQSTDKDEPLAKDGNDDTGKYGLIGLTGMLGLFGYKKYRDAQGTRRSEAGQPIGTIDTDGTGSSRI